MIDWKIMRPGRRRDDGWVAINMVLRRVCFLSYADRHANNVLEPIGMDFRLRRIGVTVWSEEWRSNYVLKHRAEWLPDDYFIAAARLFGERGIKSP